MSIPVDVADLARALEGFGAGYLLTTSATGTVKAVTVEPRVEGDVVVVDGPGGGTLRNLAGNPAVTLLLPPVEPRGFTLLVDGTGEAAGADGEDVRITPTGAVLHRPAMHGDGPPPTFDAGPASACGNDCAPVSAGSAQTASPTA